MTELRIFRVEGPALPEWADVLRIYHESFPDWEREPDALIEARTRTGRYVVWAGAAQSGAIVGFSILERSVSHHYALLAFLAVEGLQRGNGFGAQLCQHALKYFEEQTALKMLYVEAEDRQARFYGRLGFRRLDLEYYVPRFDTKGSVPMRLMAISNDPSVRTLDGKELSTVIQSIFCSGYHLEPNDERIQEQLERIPQRIHLEIWPPEGH